MAWNGRPPGQGGGGTGAQGPPGPQGPEGPQGPAGPAVTLTAGSGLTGGGLLDQARTISVAERGVTPGMIAVHNGGNLVLDPRFEKGIGAGAGWTSGASVAIDPTGSRSGGPALRLTADGLSHSSTMSAWVPVIPGETYLVTHTYKSSVLQPASFIPTGWLSLNSDGTETNRGVINTTTGIAADTWGSSSGRLIIPAGVVAAKFFVSNYSAAAHGYLWCDHMSVVSDVPGRLARSAQYSKVTDWDDALENGFYSTDTTASNNPFPGIAHDGYVVAHDVNLYLVTQTAWTSAASGAFSGANSYIYRRLSRLTGGVREWGQWYKISLSQAELDARYMRLDPVGTVLLGTSGTVKPPGAATGTWVMAGPVAGTSPALYTWVRTA